MNRPAPSPPEPQRGPAWPLPGCRVKGPRVEIPMPFFDPIVITKAGS